MGGNELGRALCYSNNAQDQPKPDPFISRNKNANPNHRESKQSQPEPLIWLVSGGNYLGWQ